jgi:two-component system, OmpR family, sensor kinase
MHLTLKAKLALTYGAVVCAIILTLGVVAYVIVSNELYANLDHSLARVASSLLTVVRTEIRASQKPLAPIPRQRPKRSLSVFEQSDAQRDFVGPVLPLPTSEAEADPVWGAVYEHMLLNSSAYVMQVASAKGNVVWRTGNLQADSLPLIQEFEQRGATVTDSTMFTYYTVSGIRYRLACTRSQEAEVTAAYPVEDVDAILRNLFALFLYCTPLALVMSASVGYYIAHRSLKPIDTLARTARQITAEHLMQRLPIPAGQDELVRLTETLNEMIARLELSFRQIRQFTSDASHELKTPLAILMGELEVAKKSAKSPADFLQTIESCLEEVERLTIVVQGLLDLSRADSGQELLAMVPVKLSLLLENVCDDLQLFATQKAQQLRTEIEPDIVVLGDGVRLHQAFLNIAENAIKYTPSGGTVTVSVTTAAQYAVCSVRDTGMGIPEDQMDRIFDRFFRVDKARSQRIGGSGLGLSITMWIVQAHGGTIQVRSKEHEGTVFVVSLPLATAVPTA